MKQFFLFFLFFGIFSVGLFFRLYHLTGVPAGFFCDEASIGYNAYEILTTGHDEYGVSFPTVFRSLDDYKLPIQIYSAVPVVAIFGLTELSTRLPSVMYGLITIVAVFFIGKELRSKQFGLLVALITATMPWLIHYNRVGFECSSYAAFFTLSALLFLKGEKKMRYIIPAFVASGVTFYTYQPAKLLVPLLVMGILFVYRHLWYQQRQKIVTGLGLFFLISIPLMLSFFTGQATARFDAVSILSAKLSFWETVSRIFQHYIFQLSPQFFLTGEPTFITRHFVGGLTPLLITTVPVFYIGIGMILITLRKKSSQILLWWLLIYPIAGAVTADPPFTTRSIIGAPLSAILIGLGIVFLLGFMKKMYEYILLTIIIGVVLINSVFFAQFYFLKYPLYSSDFWGWQYGAQPVITYFVQNEHKYDQLFMEGAFNAPYIFFDFYAPHDCANCSVGDPKTNFDSTKKQLFALTPNYLQQHPETQLHKQKTIYYPNNTPAFFIGEVSFQGK